MMENRSRWRRDSSLSALEANLIVEFPRRIILVNAPRRVPGLYINQSLPDLVAILFHLQNLIHIQTLGLDSTTEFSISKPPDSAFSTPSSK